MMITAANAADSILLEEERMARSRGLTPFFFRIELAPSYIDREFETDEPIVLTCERRGVAVATSATAQESGSKRIYMQDSMVFTLLIFRSGVYDGSDLAKLSVARNSSPLAGFEAVMIRLAIRQGTAFGEVCDVAAVDLARFIVGARGAVEDKIELQLGSMLSLQVLSTLRRTKSQLPELGCSLAVSSKSPVISEPCPPFINLPSAEAEKQIMDLAQNIYHITGANEHSREVCTAVTSDESLHSEASGDSGFVESIQVEINRSLSNRSTNAAQEAVAQSSKNKTHFIPCETNNAGEAKYERISSNIENEVESFGETSNELQEVSDREGSEDDDTGEHNRIILSEHPFTALAVQRDSAETYSCIADDGPWHESPIISHIQTPLPILVWSVQGPEETDPDDEDDMIDLGDGLMGPKRNIARLQAAAAGSSTKHGPPALPGIMSPLQKTYIRPTRTKQAMHIALGKPVDFSTCTVVQATRLFDHNQTQIEEPELSDSEDDDSQTEGGSDSSTYKNTTFEYRISALDTLDSEANTNNVDIRDGGDTSDQEGENTEDTEHARRIAELEAESVGVKQVLKKSKILMDELRKERDYLKQVLHDKVLGVHQVAATCTESDIRRINELEVNIKNDREYTVELKNDLEMCLSEKCAAEAELSKLRAEMTNESSLRIENERLLRVILSLKRELDREPGIPEVLEELKRAKFELTSERAKCQALASEVANLRNSKTPAKKQKTGFFSKSSSASSRSKSKTEKSPKSVLDGV